MQMFNEFAIQNVDGRWYSGHDQEENPTWIEALMSARLFTNYTLALLVLGRCQEMGLNVRLLWCATDEQGHAAVGH